MTVLFSISLIGPAGAEDLIYDFGAPDAAAVAEKYEGTLDMRFPQCICVSAPPHMWSLETALSVAKELAGIRGGKPKIVERSGKLLHYRFPEGAAVTVSIYMGRVPSMGIYAPAYTGPPCF